MYGFMFNTSMKEKKNERRTKYLAQKKTREKAKERENGQLLLFDGQSIDDKDYAIVLSIVF